MLEVETRGFRGRASMTSGHARFTRDNQSVFKERIYLDKNDPEHACIDEITVDRQRADAPLDGGQALCRAIPICAADWLESTSAPSTMP